MSFYLLGLELLILLALFVPRPTATRISRDQVGSSVSAGGGVLRTDINPLQAQVAIAAARDGDGVVKEDEKELEEKEGDDEDVFTAAKPLPVCKRVHFQFRRVTYTLHKSSWKGGGGGKQLLKGVDGSVRAGELCAVMGMSGSGEYEKGRRLCNALFMQ